LYVMNFEATPSAQWGSLKESFQKIMDSVLLID
jgi:hypothetical protein